MPGHHRSPDGGDLCAIFVHAGAGYHSHQNERHHLAACNDAAKVGMTILKNGGDATDAVEMCIRVLEDREITNAGYGSNLNMNGYVECDATMVDHLGRSGAIGAASWIKNPIALAHVVLNESIKPLSLSRVPPNLLVGDGVAEFASENSHGVVPHEFLVSEVARERYLKWKQDLETVAEREHEERRAEKDASKNASKTSKSKSAAVITASPPTTPDESTHLSSIPTPSRPLAASAADLPSQALHAHAGHTPHAKRVPGLPHQYELHEDDKDDEEAVDAEMEWESSPPGRPRIKRSYDGSDDDFENTGHAIPLADAGQPEGPRDDNIVDTVGAIAIDGWGNIAAGSSSGGIGMKHKGRCGPAALNGVGTAVIPMDAQDEDRVTVATVVSGTGEHMATTMAASTAADRIYYAHKKKGKAFVECSEDEALHDMIAEDFLGHPGVRLSPCPGAIGVVAVKKMKDGIYFYFAHNTDSFALASMHSEERKPVCVMSRNKGTGSIAQGGRLSRSRYARKAS